MHSSLTRIHDKQSENRVDRLAVACVYVQFTELGMWRPRDCWQDICVRELSNSRTALVDYCPNFLLLDYSVA